MRMCGVQTQISRGKKKRKHNLQMEGDGHSVLTQMGDVDVLMCMQMCCEPVQISIKKKNSYLGVMGACARVHVEGWVWRACGWLQRGGRMR